jgi:hypothetical protein
MFEMRSWRVTVVIAVITATAAGVLFAGILPVFTGGVTAADMGFCLDTVFLGAASTLLISVFIRFEGVHRGFFALGSLGLVIGSIYMMGSGTPFGYGSVVFWLSSGWLCFIAAEISDQWYLRGMLMSGALALAGLGHGDNRILDAILLLAFLIVIIEVLWSETPKLFAVPLLMIASIYSVPFLSYQLDRDFLPVGWFLYCAGWAGLVALILKTYANLDREVTPLEVEALEQTAHCYSCGQESPAHVGVCGFCGEPLGEKPKEQTKQDVPKPTNKPVSPSNIIQFPHKNG